MEPKGMEWLPRRWFYSQYNRISEKIVEQWGEYILSQMNSQILQTFIIDCFYLGLALLLATSTDPATITYYGILIHNRKEFLRKEMSHVASLITSLELSRYPLVTKSLLESLSKANERAGLRKTIENLREALTFSMCVFMLSYDVMTTLNCREMKFRQRKRVF